MKLPLQSYRSCRASPPPPPPRPSCFSRVARLGFEDRVGGEEFERSCDHPSIMRDRESLVYHSGDIRAGKSIISSAWFFIQPVSRDIVTRRLFLTHSPRWIVPRARGTRDEGNERFGEIGGGISWITLKERFFIDPLTVSNFLLTITIYRWKLLLEFPAIRYFSRYNGRIIGVFSFFLFSFSFFLLIRENFESRRLELTSLLSPRAYIYDIWDNGEWTRVNIEIQWVR